MATSYEDAVAMVEAAEKAGVVLSVGFFRRLYPSIRLMKALLHNGWPGRPRHFLVEGGGMYNWPAATLGNMKREWAGGGVLIDFGSHMVDLMVYLFSTAEKGTTANNDGLGTKLYPGPSGEGFLSPLPPPEIVEYRDNSLGGVEADCSIAVRPVRG